MLRFIAVSAAALLAFGASADTIPVHDESGAETTVDMAKLAGCRIIFDSAGAPFELCRMKKVELAPPSSTRARPGRAEKMGDDKADVVYVRAN
ncbi:hypothetical protein [Pikeienuella sp. HZG-20]|uniref:hypothetical protein n=1 Tax=Paludibacillus litoralis TaxID=3133267 RepID=UPI0030EC1DE5